MEEYELIGLMLGVAIFNSIIVDLKMPMVPLLLPSSLNLFFSSAFSLHLFFFSLLSLFIFHFIYLLLRLRYFLSPYSSSSLIIIHCPTQHLSLPYLHSLTFLSCLLLLNFSLLLLIFLINDLINSNYIIQHIPMTSFMLIGCL